MTNDQTDAGGRVGATATTAPPLFGRSPADLRHSASALWSVPLLCAGLCLVAACVLLPAADANRKLAADREQLRRDLAHADAQVAVNAGFLRQSAGDPEVAERLAERQARQVPAGADVLSLPGVAEATRATTAADMLRVPDPPAAAYEPPTGLVGSVCRDRRSQLYAIGLGAFLVAVSLVAGGQPADDRTAPPGGPPGPPLRPLGTRPE